MKNAGICLFAVFRLWQILNENSANNSPKIDTHNLVIF